MQDFWFGFVAVLPLVVGWVPVWLLAWDAGLRGGLPATFGASVGVAACDAGYAALIVLLGQALGETLALHEVPVRVAGGLVLVVMGVLGLRELRTPALVTPPPLAPGLAALRLFVAAGLNPGTAAYFAGLVAGWQAGKAVAAPSWSFVAGVGAASFSWHALVGAVGSWSRSKVSLRARRRALVIGNGLIVILGVAVAFALL